VAADFHSGDGRRHQAVSPLIDLRIWPGEAVCDGIRIIDSYSALDIIESLVGHILYNWVDWDVLIDSIMILGCCRSPPVVLVSIFCMQRHIDQDSHPDIDLAYRRRFPLTLTVFREVDRVIRIVNPLLYCLFG
jgi:hypothetical protein